MADAVTGASLTPIYERLNSDAETPRFHPVNASTFSDWSMEAGDTVTLKRGSTNFKTPVHSTTMVWKGKTPQIEVNSTGNEKRDALTKVSRQKFGRGGGAIRTAGKQFNYEVNQDRLMYEVFDEKGNLSRLTVDIKGLKHEVYDEGGSFSILKNDVSGLKNTVYDKDTGLVTKLQTQAGMFDVLCEGTGANLHVKPARIQASIDAATGNSKIQLNAQHVEISGEAVLLTGTSTIKLNDVMTVTGNAVGFKKSAIHMADVSINSPYKLNVYDVVLQGSNPITLTSSAMRPVINAVQIVGPSNNQYTLQYKTLSNSNWQDAGNFSRAVTSWLVGGGSGRINVTALPQNQMKSVNVSVDGTTSISSNGTYTFQAMYENLDGDDMPTGASRTVSVNVYPSSITMTNAKAGRTSSGVDLYYGVLYYWDDDDGSYQPASNGNRYWYYASSRISGTNTFHY